jgi:hypothetical protein
VAWLAAGSLMGGDLAPPAGSRTERVRFEHGASSTVITGKLKGYASVDYQVGAGAGQALAVTLKSGNPQNYFNVTAPGTDTSMFVGSTRGNSFEGVLPTDGDYTIRVYLMRAAARRNETARYTLTIGVTGKALAPVPASVDALVAGTPFHASAAVSCALSASPQVRQCEAFVIRRGFDGTATVEIRWPDGFKRRILFVKGKPVASDSPDPVSSSRKGDVSSVQVGADETFEIPDALVAGG